MITFVIDSIVQSTLLAVYQEVLIAKSVVFMAVLPILRQR